MQNDLNTPFAIATVGRNSKSKQPCTIFFKKIVVVRRGACVQIIICVGMRCAFQRLV